MNDSIYTIPISEVFEPKCGCPLCSLRDTLEQRAVDYITGAAMMEPDIRIETNKKGFCKEHFDQMLSGKSRLAVALMLESHLDEVKENVFGKKGLLADKRGKNAKALADSCYICGKIDKALTEMVDTAIKMYAGEKDFRKLFGEQEAFCLPHYALLLTTAEAKLPKKMQKEFADICSDIAVRNLDVIKKDISHFCKMFDYRNSGDNADWGNSKDSIARSVRFLTSRECEE